MYDFEQRRTELEQLCRQFGVAQLSAFGSAVRDDFTRTSDIDLVADIPREMSFATLMAFHAQLEDLFRRKVDILTQNGLGCMTNPFRKKSILSDLRRIYASG